MMARYQRFASDEDGAITVDWVVLTSFLVTMGAVVAFAAGTASVHQADEISAHLTALDAPAIDYNRP